VNKFHFQASIVSKKRNVVTHLFSWLEFSNGLTCKTETVVSRWNWRLGGAGMLML